MELVQVLVEYKAKRFSEELAVNFYHTKCVSRCEECPVDEMVDEFIVCDHLIHKDRATNWGRGEGEEFTTS